MRIRNEDLYYFNQGKLHDAYRLFGAHIKKDEHGNHLGVRFTVWAPHAKEVNVMGDFNGFQAWVHNLQKIDDSGIWSLFIDTAREWDSYKYQIKTFDGRELYKVDPYGFYSGLRPEQMSKVYDIDGYKWNDTTYIKNRNKKDLYESRISIYEVHLGSWMTKPDGSLHKYNELVDLLIPYVKENGFTHIELMPVTEHPLDASWGYQGVGYYSASSRFGVPKDLMYLIDQCHQNDIGIILDFVPGHICRDAHGLYMFDGQPLYEYESEFHRENVVWGTANLDLGKGEVRSFLISVANFFLEYFHVDGFRIDAVSNIFYYLGNSDNGVNHGGVEFLQQLNTAVFKKLPNAIMSAEDSTAFPGVTKPVNLGGIGFNYKWNMGFMNDILDYFETDPVYRKYEHDKLLFMYSYAFSEQYILPFSHDEVVHGKKSLINKMPGDRWQQFANYRALLGTMFTHPGKTLLFMGNEFAMNDEWQEYKEIDWYLLQYDLHSKAKKYVRDMNLVVEHHSALHESDHDSSLFKWIDSGDHDRSVFSFIRYNKDKSDFVIVVLNMTPIVHHYFKLGVPTKGKYIEIINSDDIAYGGSGITNKYEMFSQEDPYNYFDQSIEFVLSPLSVTIIKCGD